MGMKEDHISTGCPICSSPFSYRWDVQSIGQGHYGNNLRISVEEAINLSNEFLGSIVVLEQFQPERIELAQFYGGIQIRGIGGRG